MKNIYLFILILLCSAAACKKTEQAVSVRFAKINFQAAGELIYSIGYEKKSYGVGDQIPIPIGKATVGITNFITGAKLLDTVLEVSTAQTYYIYQPDTTKAPVLRTELPPPPPPPAGPFDGASPAPEGFIKFKITHQLAEIMGTDKLDIEIQSTTNSSNSTLYETIYTVPNVSATATDFILLQRPLRNGTPRTNFKFRFLRSDTKEYLKKGSGAIYATPILYIYNTDSGENLYILDAYVSYESGDPNDAEKDGLYYAIEANVMDSK